jgi:serine/threonine protein kinase
VLQALDHYHKKGVAHQDISLDNLVLDERDRLVLVDPGLSLRVPHSDPSNPDCVSDVSAGTSRRLMITQGQGGKLMYAAPEVVEKKPAVDAYAVDLWAAGVVLFVMLVGLAPFKWAHSSDKRFAQISRGGLGDLVAALDIPLSPEAIDLLQGFYYKDPRQRWNLAEVMGHPWVQGKQFKNVGLAEGRLSFPRVGGNKRLTVNMNFDGKSHSCQPNTRLVVPQNPYYC